MNDSKEPEELDDERPAEDEQQQESGGGRRRRRRERSDEDSEHIPDDDGRGKRAHELVSALVDQMGMDCRVRLRPPRDPEATQEINLEISGKDAGRVIGKRGQVLSALQFLTNRVINRPGLDKRPIVVDAEGYVSRRDDSLASMAKRLGKQAVNEGKIITFEPMNARDRRVVHMALAKFEGVITKSEGEGNDRRVQIIPVRRSN